MWRDVAAANASLLVERGFALICSHRFDDGKAMLQGCVTGHWLRISRVLRGLKRLFTAFRELFDAFDMLLTCFWKALEGQLKCSAHQLNALGYAFWKLKEFGKAAALFKMALDAEPANAIIWNNLGAALVAPWRINKKDVEKHMHTALYT